MKADTNTVDLTRLADTLETLASGTGPSEPARGRAGSGRRGSRQRRAQRSSTGPDAGHPGSPRRHSPPGRRSSRGSAKSFFW